MYAFRLKVALPMPQPEKDFLVLVHHSDAHFGIFFLARME